MLFTYGLMERAAAKGSKVIALVAHPGASLTNLQIAVRSCRFPLLLAACARVCVCVCAVSMSGGCFTGC